MASHGFCHGCGYERVPGCRVCASTPFERGIAVRLAGARRRERARRRGRRGSLPDPYGGVARLRELDDLERLREGRYRRV